MDFSDLVKGIGDFVSIGIVGSILAVVFQYIKAKMDLASFGAKMTLIIISIILGTAYWFLHTLAIWQSILGILAAASTFWALFLKQNTNA